MPCGSCAARGGRPKGPFIWTSADETQTQEYDTEIQAKARVIRKGGSYKPKG